MGPQLLDTTSSQAWNTGLAELQKALKALTFYPEKHPLREEILRKAFQAIVNLANEGGLSLIIRRNGITFANREIAVENTPMNMSLAKELFAREVQQLTLLPELSFEEFSQFLSILSMEPQTIISQGGLAEMLSAKGIRSVIANEIDITTVFTRKMSGAPSEEPLSEGDRSGSSEEGPAQETELPEGVDEDELSDLDMEALISLMDTEPVDERFRRMAQLLPGKGDLLKESGDFDRLFKNLLQLLKQNNDGRKSEFKRECALWIFQQLASGVMAGHLLDHLAEENFERKDAVVIMLGRLGGDVVDTIIGRILAAEEQHAQKALTSILLLIGPAALPNLVRMLRDNNWQTVRTAVSILGEMGNRDAVSDLIHAAHHPESPVRMEAIRSLARIGGREATALLIDLLDDKNIAIKKQSIIWLGITRNEKAVPLLLQLVGKWDLTGKLHTLKREAIIALGRIGDRQALDPLYRLVERRHLLATEQSEELKLIAVDAISQLGGEWSRDFLEKMEHRGGRLGRACSTALKTLDNQSKLDEPARMEGVCGMGDGTCQ